MTFLRCVLLVAIVTLLSISNAQNCRDPFDLFFILDGSESLSDDNFRDMKRFVIDITDQFSIAIGDVHVGALVFGSDVYSNINLEGRDDRGRLIFDILTLSRLRGGYTETDKAIANMRQEFSTNGRASVPSVCVVITDGKSLFPDNTIDQARRAREQGIYMIALGFGNNIFLDELRDIASSDDVVFNTTEFDTLVEATTTRAIKEAVCAPSSAPVNVRATPISLNSIRVDWEEPISHSSTILGYRIYITTDASQSISFWSNVNVGALLRTSTLTGLTSNVVYTIRMLAYSANGQGPLSDAVMVLINNGGPGSAPRNVRARPLNQETIMVEWDEPEITNGVIQGYRIWYTTDSSLSLSQWSLRDIQTTFSVAPISGLSANTIYTIRMAAYTSSGQGPLSAAVRVITNNGEPGSAPRNLRVRSYILQTLILEWNPPDTPNGQLQGYRLYYTTDATQPMSSWNTQAVSSGVTMATIGGILSERRYSVRILAYNGVGDGPLSDVLEVLTFTGIPGSAPTNIRATSYSSQSISLTWGPPIIANGAIQGYRIYYTTNPSQPTSSWAMLGVNTGVNVATLSGLASDATYTIRMFAYSGAGQGPLSGFLQVRTNSAALVTTTPSGSRTGTSPPDTGGLDNGLDCDDCMITDTLGYLSYDGYCGKYIQIYSDANGQRTSVVRKCREGLFWDNTAMTCTRPQDTNCEFDVCLSQPVGYTYAVDDLCSGFITCMSGQSHLACCGTNERWTASNGCVFDPSCSDACGRIDDNRLVHTHECKSFAIPGDRRNYIEDIVGLGNVTRPCPPGTLFNEGDCMCTDMDNNPPSRLDECEPSADFSFSTDFNDASKEMVYAGTSNVNINEGSAVFAGNGMVNLYRFANVEFRSELVISFRFEASGLGDATQSLVSNCIASSVYTASIDIKIVPLARTLVMVIGTENDRKELSFIYNEGSFNDVTYVYDGTCMTGVVNGNIKSAALTGNIRPRRSGIILGSGSKTGYFSGNMKNFRLYKCMPTSVDAFIGRTCS